ncbi:MAG: GTP 3',8-cyclase MoaA [Dissulfuribacterales bacterium]
MMLSDDLGRNITYLRVSVTDRCNLQCFYCSSPDKTSSQGTQDCAETCRFLPMEELLTDAEILRVVKTFSKLGVQKIRLTGGEPLLRPNLADIVQSISQIPSITDISLTTNGIFLLNQAQALKDAGIKRLNISLDTLQPERYKTITGHDEFQRVWDGILHCLDMGFSPVKLNVVMIKGVNDDELIDLAALTLKWPVQVRFIEFMPIGRYTSWNTSKHLSCDEMKRRIQESIGQLDSVTQGKNAGPAEVFALTNALGNLGFISPISRHFCATCNRVRLTADGHIRLCLFSDNELDLKAAMRNGISDDELTKLLQDTIRRKPAGLDKSIEGGTETGAAPSCRRRMSTIGG